MYSIEQVTEISVTQESWTQWIQRQGLRRQQGRKLRVSKCGFILDKLGYVPDHVSGSGGSAGGEGLILGDLVQVAEVDLIGIKL